MPTKGTLLNSSTCHNFLDQETDCGVLSVHNTQMLTFWIKRRAIHNCHRQAYWSVTVPSSFPSLSLHLPLVYKLFVY